MNFALAPAEQLAFPDANELAAIRAWFAGLSSTKSVAQYLPDPLLKPLSARSRLSRIRSQLAGFARARQRSDLAKLFTIPERDRGSVAGAAIKAMDILRDLKIPQPRIYDDVDHWLSPHSVKVLKANGIKTLADLTVRIPRRKQWWVAVPGMGVSGARRIERFFAAYPDLTRHALQLVSTVSPRDIVPWELMHVPASVDGTLGKFRTPEGSSTLESRNDYDAVNTWIASHEVAATQRSYRKEAERLMLWAILERGKALSSLTAEDAIAYRTFLRRPQPAQRWIGNGQARSSGNWKPFTGSLKSRSISYAFTVIGSMFRYLIAHRYLLANPFAGLKVKGGQMTGPLDVSRFFGEGEWAIIRAVANGLEWSDGWELEAAQRLRFSLDFTYATGLRSSELVRATLGDIKIDSFGDHWLTVLGKGSKFATVALPPLARSSLDQYLMHRQLPVTRERWNSKTRIIGSIGNSSLTGITSTRLWAVFKRFFMLASEKLKDQNTDLSAKLARASPHWMRHSHATNALSNGVDLKTVRDNLRHASINTTSVYLHTDDHTRARQIGTAFATRL
jgi:site-specific recombinase XerD